jgi:hypothetical protein
LGFVRAKKQRRDQTPESLRGAQKRKSRNECGFELGVRLSAKGAPVKMDWVQCLAVGLCDLGMGETKSAGAAILRCSSVKPRSLTLPTYLNVVC